MFNHISLHAVLHHLEMRIMSQKSVGGKLKILFCVDAPFLYDLSLYFVVDWHVLAHFND